MWDEDRPPPLEWLASYFVQGIISALHQCDTLQISPSQPVFPACLQNWDRNLPEGLGRQVALLLNDETPTATALVQANWDMVLRQVAYRSGQGSPPWQREVSVRMYVNQTPQEEQGWGYSFTHVVSMSFEVRVEQDGEMSFNVKHRNIEERSGFITDCPV
ncbi:MAG: hypothetical protein K1Y36_08690 [Blastocatellia bacterium]|nr:hypothetical protein [Blastocatellia bacterium]